MRYLYTTVMLTALTAILIPSEGNAQGQQGSGSPYTAYGIGDLIGSTQVSQALMGGMGVGLIDPYSTIHANPASYVALRTPAFETGIASRILKYDMVNASASGRRSDLLGISLGVPIGKGSVLEGTSQPANRWGFALGVHPLSRVGYTISEVQQLNDGSDVRFEYSGNGGLNQAFIGLALTAWQSNDTIHKGTKLAIGANFNYVFGSIEELRKAYYPLASNIYNSSVSTRLNIRSPRANVGAQLSGDIISMARAEARSQRRNEKARDGENTQISNRAAEPLRYTLGISAELPANLKARRSELVNSFAISGSGLEIPFDTSFFQDAARGNVEIPILYGVGFSLYNSRWTVAIEHRRRDWSQFAVRVDETEFGEPLGLQTGYALGASFRPAGDRNGTLLQRTTYRAGMRYAQDYRLIAGTQFQEIGMGFGIALPVMANTTRSRITFGAEVGERGSTDLGLLRERFVNVFVGITITPDLREQWFKKRRLE